MLRFLAGLVLLEAAVMGGVIAARDVFALDDALVYQREAAANRFYAEKCEKKHETLLRQVKREGLWRRLGLGAQPWLQ